MMPDARYQMPEHSAPDDDQSALLAQAQREMRSEWFGVGLIVGAVFTTIAFVLFS